MTFDRRTMLSDSRAWVPWLSVVFVGFVFVGFVFVGFVDLVKRFDVVLNVGRSDGSAQEVYLGVREVIVSSRFHEFTEHFARREVWGSSVRHVVIGGEGDGDKRD